MSLAALCFCHCHRTQSHSADDVPYSQGNLAKYAAVLADVERVASAWYLGYLWYLQYLSAVLALPGA